MEHPLRLNLGCGKRPMPGFVNVDKYGTPDVRHDLEVFPWPFATDAVSEVRLTHTLEHLGSTAEVFLRVMQELYRVCAPNALVHVTVPHPRSDDFINDPTHLRAITPEGLQLFSKALNLTWMEEGHSNSPLGLHLDVDFELQDVTLVLEEPWRTRLATRALPEAEIREAIRQYFNVVKEIRMVLRVVK